MITYEADVEGVDAEALVEFYEGWPAPPSPPQRLAVLEGSSHVVLAFDGDRLVGFVTAVSDGVLSAFIPLLEVLPDHRGKGIGSELVRRMLGLLEGLYSIDLVCDDDLVPFYERFGLRRGTAMTRRDREAFGR
ncbi:MAG TPA: GNAT family N-acetyltransferase [Acidimicrobiia bacterium]|nr:GNAT family N-acetyltransferase [Acidimicrobiia bacterium]